MKMRNQVNQRAFLLRLRSLFIYVLSIPLYWISFIIPRNKKIWIFGAWLGNRYSDNSRFVYEYVCEKERSIRAVWLSRDASIVDAINRSGPEAYMVNSWRGYWISCRAAAVISSNAKLDINRPAISRAKKIQLWHGIPLKKMGLDDKITHNFSNHKLRYYKLLLYKFTEVIRKILFPFSVETWDIIISTSPLMSERMATAFGVPLSNVKITGYPRNDILLRINYRSLDVIKKIKESFGITKFILYAPTFRNLYDDNVYLFKGFNIEELEACCSRHNAVFFIKMHPVFKNVVPIVQDKTSARLHWLTEDDVSELNDLLPDIDILISDYSGAYLDYLLLNRPIIFTPFDLNKYLERDRELYENYEQATPGVKCANWTEVFQTIDKILSGYDNYSIERKTALEKYHTYCDDKSSMRVFKMVRSLLQDSVDCPSRSL